MASVNDNLARLPRRGGAFAEGEALIQETRLGSVLEAARRGYGLSLPEISQHIKVRVEYLKAIEEGNIASILGMTYALGFIRTYACYLGLDGDDMVQLFKSEQVSREEAPLTLPSPLPAGGAPKRWIIILSILGILGFWGGWYYFS